ncbi:MAG: response regulator [Bacteroidetes bacterium HGW-Bacteroidetes-4]|jgi:response regulator RpfG family c-di-GMP phosphodiesterase|nr:MAG: response regulator [Bacteroidetes bacterium HGW-Bacteroidetes-4]
MSQEVTLLYVDDEPINLTLFEINFRRKYKVITAGSGAEGLQKLEGNRDIIVVISDMKMPGMNGIEFIKKAKEHYRHIAYFILTAFDINKEIKEALDQQLINRYFNKPFNIKEIDGAIQAFLRSI